jgi:hypothetical protein
MPLNLYAESTSDSFSMNEVLKTSLDMKVNSSEDFTMNSNNSSDIILDHILDVNPDLTTGELNAIYTMMNEQFDSEFGNKKIEFYEMYLNNSSEYPVDGLPYTARELYNNDYYKGWVNSVERIISDYGHMSQQTRVSFLITKNPNMKNIMDVFDNADRTEKLYLAGALTKFDLPTYPTYSDGKPSIDIRAIKKYKSDLHDAVKALAKDILGIDQAYKLDYKDILPDVDDFNKSLNNSMDKINDEINIVDRAIKNSKGFGIGCTIAGGLLILIGSCGLIKTRPGTQVIQRVATIWKTRGGSYIFAPTLDQIEREMLEAERVYDNVEVPKITPMIIRIILFLLIPIGAILLGIGIYLLILGYCTLVQIYGFLIEIKTEMQKNNKNFYI